MSTLAPRTPATLRTWLWSNGSWLLLTFAFASLAIGELYRHLLTLIGLLGIYAMFTRAPAIVRDHPIRRLGVLFSLVWIPMLLSLPDAINLDRSAGATLRYVTYFFAGVALLRMPWHAESTRRLLYGISAVMLFLSVDGLYQFAAGKDLFGNPAFPDGRITGPFQHSPRLGFLLAILSPVYFEAIRLWSARSNWAWLALLPLVAAILLGGSRSSWLLLGTGTLLYAVFYWRVAGFPKAATLARVAIVLLVGGIVVSQVDWLGSRLQAVAGLFSGDYEQANSATSNRLPIWQAAIAMTEQHWLNGVGVRGYGTVYYHTYPDREALMFHGENGHPHFFALEIAAECGVIGLLGYVALLYLLLRWSFTPAPTASSPLGLAAFVAAFPLSSTLSFYAPFCATLVWLLIVAWVVAGRESAAAK